jgi:hypothetical protein
MRLNILHGNKFAGLGGIDVRRQIPGGSARTTDVRTPS